jgi:trk system potassium uptake protein TrkH
MRYSNREKLSNYFDLFFLFIELDIFIWVLFELSYVFRPIVYEVGRILIIIFILEIIVQFFFSPTPRTYFKKCWHLFVNTAVLFFLFNWISAVDTSHRFIFLYSRLFLLAVEFILFAKFLLQSSRIREIYKTFRVSPAQIIVLSFAGIILIGSFILYLPYSRNSGEDMRYIDALFTSTSAVCVTGLVVVDTGTAFSRVGQVFLLLLIQTGGLGIMTIAAFIQVSLGSQMSLYGRYSTAALLDESNLKNLYTIIRSIVFITFSIEAFGVILFLPHFLSVTGNRFEAIFYSLFHSISAFCNAGFSLYRESFTGAVSSVWANAVLIVLIVSGGMGFTVLLNIARKVVRGSKERILVQTKIVLLTTVSLLIFGAVVFYLFERNNVLSGLAPYEKFMASLFQSVTPRTAGFNTVSISALRFRTMFMLLILMFIGASPGSTGGGIKTTTFFILILTIITILKDQRFNNIFNRRIPYQVINRAIAILVSAVGFIILGGLLLGLSEGFPFTQILFETVSAFGTVGLSTGITPLLSDFGKIVVMLCMLVGRIGPLTMVLAIGNAQKTRLITYPEERVMIG